MSIWTLQPTNDEYLERNRTQRMTNPVLWRRLTRSSMRRRPWDKEGFERPTPWSLSWPSVEGEAVDEDSDTKSLDANWWGDIMANGST
jgi:hypothetical protein